MSPPPSNRTPLRFVLTGAAGALGAVLGNALVDAGADVLGIDMRPTREARFPITVRDLREAPLDHEHLAGRDVVIHFACHARFETAPGAIQLADNARIDRSVLVPAAAAGVRTIIAASTCQAITPGPPTLAPPWQIPYLPVDGHFPLDPFHAYGASKGATEALMRELADQDGRDGRGGAYVVLRLPKVVTDAERATLFGRHYSGATGQEGCAFLLADELGPLVLAIARAGLTGYRSYLPAMRENTFFLPPQEVVRRFYPGVPLRRPLAELDSLVDVSELTRDTGWRPQPVFRAPLGPVRRVKLALEARLRRPLPDPRWRVRRLLAQAQRRVLAPPLLGHARLAHDARAELGEGPFWHPDEQALYWVDITGRALHRHRPGKDDQVMALDEWVSAVFAGPGREVLVALRDRLAWVDFDARALRPHAAGSFEAPPNRLNDGKHDPRGRLWVGSMHLGAPGRRTGALFRIDDGGAARVLDDVGCSNGLAWSNDGATMYYVDSHDRAVDAFDYDLERGVASGRRRVFTVPTWLAGPDGLCSDVEGCLWVALHGGGAVVRVDPRDGRMLGQVAVPTARVTSCAFGGPDLTTLYITTARALDARARPVDPPAGGGLYAFDSAVRGAPVRGAAAPTLP